MQKLIYKNNLLGYYKFYYYFVGYRIWVYLTMSIILSFIDGIGLALFIPMLQISSGEMTREKAKSSMGGMHYIIDFMDWSGLPLTLFGVLGVMVGLFSLKGLLGYVKTMYMAKIQNDFMTRLRCGLVENLRDADYISFLKYDAGSIQNVLVSEVYRVLSVFTNLIGFFEASVSLMAYVILAFTANYKFAFLVLVGGALISLAYRRLYAYSKRMSNSISEKSQDFNRLLIQSVLNFKYLKSTARFGQYADKVTNVINESQDISFKMTKYGSIMGSIREPLVILIVAFIILLQVSFMHGNLSSIIMSLLFFYRCLLYLMNTQQTWQQVVFNSGGLGTVSGMWNDMMDGQENETGVPYHSPFRTLRIDNVNYSYGTNRVLHGVNIPIDQKKTIAFVGESGSGKTTMVNLLTGLLNPESGDVLVDGTPLSQMQKNSFRSHIGYISQDPVIFNDTVFNNVSFWDAPTPEHYERFWHALQMASIAELIKELPEQEKTNLGDNGIRLSGGQKQRISIARELYKNVDLLIMDEATSALDSETEHEIKENINSLKGQYTMVIIAHRLATIKEADTIYLFEKGKVSGSGNFNELVELSPKFKRMVELQEI